MRTFDLTAHACSHSQRLQNKAPAGLGVRDVAELPLVRGADDAALLPRKRRGFSLFAPSCTLHCRFAWGLNDTTLSPR